jgi:hypothetical protein
MIISSPPFQVGEELRSGLRCGPGAACQRCHSMTDSQWSPLDKSRVEPPREAQSEALQPGELRLLQDASRA